MIAFSDYMLRVCAYYRFLIMYNIRAVWSILTLFAAFIYSDIEPMSVGRIVKNFISWCQGFNL